MARAARLSTLPARFAGFIGAVFWRFYDDQGLMRASALAYVSLLSMVPLLAVMFAVLKGLGVEQRLESILLSRLALSQETTQAIIDFVDRVNVGTLGALGAAMLLVTVISLLGGVEEAFNANWRVAQSRSLWRQVTDYLSVVLLTPFLLLAAVAITSSLQAEIVFHWLLETRYLGDAALMALKLLPIVMNIVAVAILYAVMPNRRPRFGPLMLGATFAGIAWHLVQLAYIQFQIGMAGYNSIYGALSQLPITLVWLYVSWAVVLLGAEIAAVAEFGWEHIERAGRPPSLTAVALHILTRAAESFLGGGGTIDPVRIARELGVAPETVNQAISFLRLRNWLAPVADRRSYLLAMAPERITLAGIERLDSENVIPRGIDPKVRAALDQIAVEQHEVWACWTLADVLDPERRKAVHEAPATPRTVTPGAVTVESGPRARATAAAPEPPAAAPTPAPAAEEEQRRTRR